MTASRSPRRALCQHCLRPDSACLCHCVQAVDSQVQLLVLQHPQEVGHAKNTARLLHLCLRNSQLVEGEHFDPQALQHLLHAPWPGQAENALVRPVLLYPPTPPDPQLPVLPAPALPGEWLHQPQTLRLVLLDGTWRKSRKMLYLNPALQTLPRCSLADVPASRYAIRKAQSAGQLSSFEAAALALAQLQNWPDNHPHLQQLMHSFDGAMQLHQRLQAANQTGTA